MKKEISELTKIQLIKRNNGYMIAFLCGILAALFLLAGAAISFSGKKVALGVVLLAIAVLSAVGPLILYLWKRKKYLPLAVNKWAEDITATLAKQTGQRKFRAYEGVEAEFFADEVVVNGKHYKKEEAEAVYCVCVQPRLIYDEVELAVALAIGEEGVCFPLNGDLLATFTENEWSILGEEDFIYFQKNANDCTKKLLRQAAFLAAGGKRNFIPLQFVKSKKEKKAKDKASVKAYAVMLSIFFGIVAIGLLMASGIPWGKFLVIILFTASFFLFAFVKAKKVAVWKKILLCVYPAVFWLSIFFASERLAAFFDGAFMLIFFLLSFVGKSWEYINKKGPELRFALPAVLMLLLTGYDWQGTELLDERAYLTVSVGAMLLFLLVGTVGALLRVKKQKEAGRYGKKERSTAIVIPLLLAMLGFFFGFYYGAAANYIFDKSQPIVCEATVEKLQSSKHGRYVRVTYEGESINISVGLEYYKSCEEGDGIVFEVYEGAFGWRYIPRVYENKGE